MVTKKNKSITIYMYTHGNNSIYNSEKKIHTSIYTNIQYSMNYFSINHISIIIVFADLSMTID